MEWMIYAVLFILLCVVLWEWFYGHLLYEGYENNVPAYFGKFFPRRSDAVPGQVEEQDGYVRNKRYSEAYADIQGLGYKADFCRVVERPNDPESRRVVCALAGQEGLDTFSYSSKSARGGIRFSRDDYYRDVNGDKRDDYCRILKVKDAPLDAWEARCIPAGLVEFKSEFELTDSKPPADIAELLFFFEGIMVWYRFLDDMVDYAENSKLALAGSIEMDETPVVRSTAGVESPQRGINETPVVRSDPPPRIHGLEINKLPAIMDEKPPAEQFIRIGENDKLEWESKVRLRDLRAVSVWVYFDEFTQNAPIFDFGNGAGKDNVRLAIEGKGNRATKLNGVMRPQPTEFAKVCNRSAAVEVSPKLYLATSDANVDEYECKGPEPIESTFPEDDSAEEAGPPSANLIFEIWDTQQRKMRIRAINAIPLKKWCHVVVTTTDASSFRPTWHVYIDNRKVLEELDGHMPLNSYTTKNYIGKSNWEEVGVGQYDDQDERFRGSLFDFRLYRLPMSPAKIKKTYDWGHARL